MRRVCVLLPKAGSESLKVQLSKFYCVQRVNTDMPFTAHSGPRLHYMSAPKYLLDIHCEELVLKSKILTGAML